MYNVATFEETRTIFIERSMELWSDSKSYSRSSNANLRNYMTGVPSKRR